jgi:hypothetical protein
LHDGFARRRADVTGPSAGRRCIFPVQKTPHSEPGPGEMTQPDHQRRSDLSGWGACPDSFPRQNRPAQARAAPASIRTRDAKSSVHLPPRSPRPVPGNLCAASLDTLAIRRSVWERADSIHLSSISQGNFAAVQPSTQASLARLLPSSMRPGSSDSPRFQPFLEAQGWTQTAGQANRPVQPLENWDHEYC